MEVSDDKTIIYKVILINDDFMLVRSEHLDYFVKQHQTVKSIEVVGYLYEMPFNQDIYDNFYND
jgi:hypothetical protein